MMHHQRTNVVGCQSHCFAWYHFETLVTSHTHKNDSSCLIQDYMPSSQTQHYHWISGYLPCLERSLSRQMQMAAGPCWWTSWTWPGRSTQQFHSHELHCQSHYMSKASCSPISDYYLLYRQGNNCNLHNWVYLLKLTNVGVSPLNGYHTLIQHLSMTSVARRSVHCCHMYLQLLIHVQNSHLYSIYNIIKCVYLH